jgi:hypothetical protein
MTKKGVLKQIFGVIATTALAVLPLVGLMWSMGQRLFFGTFTYVLNGHIFKESWNRVHAGSTLDQPTIGKWYFWFTVFTVIGLFYMTIIYKFCVQKSKLRHWFFAAPLTILCLFFVCLLTIPFWWLIQYVHEIGYTGKRMLGLLYGIGGYLIVLLYYFWVVRFKMYFSKSKKREEI